MVSFAHLRDPSSDCGGIGWWEVGEQAMKQENWEMAVALGGGGGGRGVCGTSDSLQRPSQHRCVWGRRGVQGTQRNQGWGPGVGLGEAD